MSSGPWHTSRLRKFSTVFFDGRCLRASTIRATGLPHQTGRPLESQPGAVVRHTLLREVVCADFLSPRFQPTFLKTLEFKRPGTQKFPRPGGVRIGDKQVRPGNCRAGGKVCEPHAISGNLNDLFQRVPPPVRLVSAAQQIVAADVWMRPKPKTGTRGTRWAPVSQYRRR